MKEYKIDHEKIPHYVNRSSNRLSKIFLYAYLSMHLILSLYFFIVWDDLPTEIIHMLPVLGIVTLLMGLSLVLINVNGRKFNKIIAEHLVIRIDDHSVTSMLMLDKEPRMNFLHKNTYIKLKRTHNIDHNTIAFKDIKTLTDKKNALWVRSKNANKFDGSGMIVIPKELRGFSDIKSHLERII